MMINYLSPYIRVAMDSIIDFGWTLEERVIFDYELLYVKEGQAIVTIEDIAYNSLPGDIFLFKPKQKHSIQVVGGTAFRQPHIHFDLFYRKDSPNVKVSFKSLDKMSEDELKYFRKDDTVGSDIALPNKISIRNIKYFEDMLFEIIKEFQARDPFYEIIIKGLFLKLWAFLLRENNIFENPMMLSRIDEFESIKEYLNENYNREITLDELSREFNISKYHLTRIFKKLFGVTPIHYNRLIRIQKSKEMVQFSSMSLTNISETLGFNSINAFSRAFRNVEGVPPSFYRGR